MGSKRVCIKGAVWVSGQIRQFEGVKCQDLKKNDCWWMVRMDFVRKATRAAILTVTIMLRGAVVYTIVRSSTTIDDHGRTAQNSG